MYFGQRFDLAAWHALDQSRDTKVREPIHAHPRVFTVTCVSNNLGALEK